MVVAPFDARCRGYAQTAQDRVILFSPAELKRALVLSIEKLERVGPREIIETVGWDVSCRAPYPVSIELRLETLSGSVRNALNGMTAEMWNIEKLCVVLLGYYRVLLCRVEQQSLDESYWAWDPEEIYAFLQQELYSSPTRRDNVGYLQLFRLLDELPLVRLKAAAWSDVHLVQSSADRMQDDVVAIRVRE